MFYDAQQLRIQAGNRGVTSTEGREVALEEADIAFLDAFSSQLSSLEGLALKEVARLLKGVPIYETWLKKQSGCGPTMSGVILSEVDIRRCETVSQLWAFAGLGVDDDGRTQRLTRGSKAGFNVRFKSKMVGVLAGCIIKAGGAAERARRIAAVKAKLGEGYFDSPAYSDFFDKHVAALVEEDPEEATPKRGKNGKPPVNNGLLAKVIEEYDIPLTKTGGWVDYYSNYKRRKQNTIMPICMGCKGTGERTEKIMGIEGGKASTTGKTPGAAHKCETCEGNGEVPGPDPNTLVLCGDCAGEGIVQDWKKKAATKKHKCENCGGSGKDAPWGESKAHRNNAAKRYMIKMFLKAMWIQWRTLEGLSVGETYEARYLHMQHGDHGPSRDATEAWERRRADRLTRRAPARHALRPAPRTSRRPEA
jgi:hypothetical protein